jgi:hypothetical protein
MPIAQQDTFETDETKSTETKSIQRRAQRHRRNVWFGKSIRRHVASQGVIRKNAEMGGEQERRPENRRSNRKMVIEMARGRVLRRKNIPLRIRSAHAEAEVGPEPVLLEIEIVLD